MEADRVAVGRGIEWWLSRLSRVGPKTMESIEARIGGDFASLLDESATSLEAMMAEASVDQRARRQITPDALKGARRAWEAEREGLAAGTELLHHGEERFPARLAALDSPPRFLYVRGQVGVLAAKSTVSIVGSREARVSGIRQTRDIAEALAAAGHVVISGGAIGVDAAAHLGALEAGASTGVVLPGCVERPRPAKNSRIFRRAVEHGCLLSEHPVGTSVRSYHFHRRNRLIAALGDWLIVVRAGRESGTMITAKAAAGMQRPILTMAGAADDGRFAGCVDLLAAGARCVRGASDVLYAIEHPADVVALVDLDRLEVEASESTDAAPAPQEATRQVDTERRERLGDTAQAVLELFDSSEEARLHADELRRAWADEASRLESALLELELKGIVEKVPGKNAYRAVG